MGGNATLNAFQLSDGMIHVLVRVRHIFACGQRWRVYETIEMIRGRKSYFRKGDESFPSSKHCRFLIGSCFNSASTISLRRSDSCWGTCLFWSVDIFFPSHLLGCILCKVAGRLAISTSNYLNKINNKHLATRNVVRLIRGTQVRLWERWGEIIFSVTTLDVIFIFRRLLLHVRTILVYNCIEVDPKESKYKKSS